MPAVREAVDGVLKPAAVLDFLRFFTLYATDKKHRKIKIIARFQQFQATNLIVDRVLLGQVKQGLIWHFQGSGKSLLMVFTALKLRAMAGLSNPTILIVVDRIDLDTQITGTFNASDVPDLVSTDSRAELHEAARRRERARSSSRRSTSSARHPASSTRATTSSRWSTRRTAPRRATTAARCARRCRTRSCSASPAPRSTGATATRSCGSAPPEDEGGYLSRYSMQDSIRDGATLPLHFEPRLSEIHIDEEAIDAAFEELAAAA